MRKEIFLCREAFVKTRNTARASAMSIRYNSDHRFSLCDAVSFEVMRRERIEHALTFDTHFTIAGYKTL